MKDEKSTLLIFLGVVAILAVVGMVLLSKSWVTGKAAASGFGGSTHRVFLTAEQACGRFTSQDGLPYVPAVVNGQYVYNKAANLVKCVPSGIHPGASDQGYYDELHAIWAALTTGRSGQGYGTVSFV